MDENYPSKWVNSGWTSTYIDSIEKWAHQELGRSIKVSGYLIGTLDTQSQARDIKVLRKEIEDAGPTANWKVLTLHQMLTTARTIHVEALVIQEAEDKRLDDLLS